VSRVGSVESVLHGVRLAILLLSRYWAVTVLGPIRYVFRELTDDRVAMLTFTGSGKGTARFSTIALIVAWIGCIVLDFSHTSGFFLLII
jgi:hypothetical protein